MILLIFPLIVNLKRRVGTGDRNMHLSSKGLLHVSQIGQDLTSDHLLDVQLAHTLTVAGQAGEGHRPDDGGSAGTAAAALNNGDLGDAQFAGLSDHGVLGRLALFQNASSNGGVGDLLHILSTDHLLAHNLLQLSREWRAGLLDSVGEGSLLESLGHAGLSSLDVVSLVAVKVSAETALVSAVSGMFQLNSLSIVGSDLLLFIFLHADNLSINSDLILPSGFSPGAGRLHGNLGSLNKDLNLLLAINNLSKDSMGMALTAVRAEDVEAVIQFVAVGLVVKGLDNTITNRALFIDRATNNRLNNLFMRSDSGSQRNQSSQFFRQADVVIVNGLMFSGESHV